MRITVRETVRNGLVYPLSVEPSTTIGQLKQLLYEASTWDEESSQGMCFTFDDDILDQDDQTLKSYGVDDQSRLEWTDLTAVGRSDFGSIGRIFIDLANKSGLKKQAWSTTAPEWRRARHGLCFEGICTSNPSCKAHKKQVIIPIGYTKFDFVQDVNKSTSKCPVCQKYVHPISCGFNNCWWKFEGRKVEKDGDEAVDIESEWEPADDAYHYFDQQLTGMVRWLRLELEVVKKNPVLKPSG